MNPFTILTSRVVLLPMDDIDTDQIIPARFLKTTSKIGLGKQLFADWRYQADGSPTDFVLNDPRCVGASILLAGDNFGCGSSREHAPWALLDYGFRAIISTSFADIFRNNSLKNGLLPLIVDLVTLARLVQTVSQQPEQSFTIDLAHQQLLLPGGETVTFPIDSFSKNCLLKGVDELGYLMSFSDRIAAYEAAGR
jgi:3-isopropylmalate/(R)-2-methylmalate dehydratase small subunit